uniref:Uncharacterized protein n=1 Tax=Anopheles maculatus TaxID=74869 RepID=A0A182STN2_9DIPT
MMYASRGSDRSRPGSRSAPTIDDGWERAEYHQQQPQPQQQQRQRQRQHRQGQRDGRVRPSPISRAYANARLLVSLGTLALLVTSVTTVVAVGGVSLTGSNSASVQISGASAARWTKATETGSDLRRVPRSPIVPGRKLAPIPSSEETEGRFGNKMVLLISPPQANGVEI